MNGFVSSLNQKEVVEYVNKQLATFFPDKNQYEVKNQISQVIEITMDRVSTCFSKVKSRYYAKDNKVFFNHLNGDHYSMFLYLLSNDLFKLTGDEDTAAKVFLLNKALFGIDAFYRIELPAYFLFIHPVGTILGNGVYKNFFVTYQGVTVGSKIDGVYPKFGERTILYSNCSVIGSVELGSNCIMAANSFLLDTIVADNQVIVGTFPKQRIIANANPTIDYYFRLD